MKELIGAVAIAAIGVGCGGTDAFEGYGSGHPGQGLKHGGQLFLELVHRPDTWTGSQGWLNAYKRSFNDENLTVADTLPIPPIPAGTCMDISTDVFPRQFGDVTYEDLGPSVTLRPEDTAAPALTADQFVPTEEKPVFVDNLQFGVANGYQNQTFDIADIKNDMYYDIEFEGSENLEPNRIYMPPAYEVYSPAVGKEDLTFTRGEDLVINWEPLNQDAGGSEHSPERTFTNVIFVSIPPNGPQGPGQKKVVCPINDGEGHDTFTVPASVLDIFENNEPDVAGGFAGIMITGQPTHMMAKMGEERFDLIAIECNQSRFKFADE